MANKLVRQSINGKQVNSVVLPADALTAVSGLLEGHVVIFAEDSTGGVLSAYPATLNSKLISFGKKVGKRYESGSIRVKHVKTTKESTDIRPLIIGKFKCNYASAVSAEYCNVTDFRQAA